MLQPPSEQTAIGEQFSSRQNTLQLLLFVDNRPNCEDNLRQIHNYLQSLREEYPFDLEVIEISQKPHLVEYFKLVATPALIKLSPGDRHTLAGSNLTSQLQKWWPKWVSQLQQEEIKHQGKSENEALSAFTCSAEVMRLSDEVFRLQKEKEELIAQLQFKDQVLAMLAHDLRNPLTAASIALETMELADHQTDPECRAKLVEQLHKQAHKQFEIMNRMICDLLQASKSMSVQLQIKPIRLELYSLCCDVINQFYEPIREKSQSFITDIPQDLPCVHADEELVRQVLVNLLENAVKYTPSGGSIHLTALHRTAQKIQISVCDNGPGIPKEKRDRIFEGHFRLKRDQEQEGYGIGLSLCRKAIRAHYGQIWVDSSPSGGSCFYFTLPVYQK